MERTTMFMLASDKGLHGYHDSTLASIDRAR